MELEERFFWQQKLIEFSDWDDGDIDDLKMVHNHLRAYVKDFFLFLVHSEMM